MSLRCMLSRITNPPDDPCLLAGGSGWDDPRLLWLPVASPAANLLPVLLLLLVFVSVFLFFVVVFSL